MFIIIESLKNIIRNKFIYIISGLFLFTVISISSCALLFSISIPHYINELQDYYFRQINFKFREELQWQGREDLDYTIRGFNSDSSMDKYNYTLNVTRDYFEQFARIEYVDDISLVYNENAIIEYGSSKRAGKFEAALFGGELLRLRDTNNRSSKIIKGKVNSKGECLVSREMSVFYEMDIGDALKIVDKNGNVLNELKISGIYGFVDNDNKNTILQNHTAIRVGTNPFFRYRTPDTYVIVTDFDTTYYLYGKDENSKEFLERHDWNKYSAWYEIDKKENFNAFIEETKKYPFDKNQGFYQDKTKFEIVTSAHRQIMDDARRFNIIANCLAGFTVLVLSIFLIKERRYDIGVLYACGVSRLKIIASYLIEIVTYVFIITGMSVFGGKLYMWLLRNDSLYGDTGLKYAVSPEYLLALFSNGLIISLTAVIFVVVYVLRASPADLLGHRR